MVRRGKEPAADAPFARLGAALRARREQLGLTQEKLAVQTGIKQTQISAFELGKRLPSEERQHTLQETFGWPEGRIVRLAGLAEEPSTLADFLEGDPQLTPKDRRTMVGLYRLLVEQNGSTS